MPGFDKSLFHTALFLLEGWTTPNLVQKNIWLLVSHLPYCSKGTKCLQSAIDATKINPRLKTPVTSRNEYAGCFENYGAAGFVEGIKVLLQNKNFLFTANSSADMIPHLISAMKGGRFPPSFPHAAVTRLVYDFLAEGTKTYPPLLLDANILIRNLAEFQNDVTTKRRNAEVADDFKTLLEPYLVQRKETGATVYSASELTILAFDLYMTGLTELYPFLEKYSEPFDSNMYQRLIGIWKTRPCMSKYSAFRHTRLAHWLKDHGFPQVVSDWREIVPNYHTSVILAMLRNICKQGDGDELWLLEDLFGPDLITQFITDSVILENLRFVFQKPHNVKFSLCFKNLAKMLEIYARKGSPFRVYPQDLKDILEKSKLPKALAKDLFTLLKLD